MVWLSVRPVAVRLHAEGGADDNVFTARLHGSMYLGEVAQHLAELPGGVTLKALEARPRVVARDGEKAEARVVVAAEDVQVLTE